MLFIVNNLLDAATLSRIGLLIHRGTFVDGSVTVKLPKTMKHNLEFQIGEPYALIAELLNAAIDSSEMVANRLLPRYRTNPILNKYEAGMFYKNHIDGPIQGGASQAGRLPGRFGQSFVRTDYSMTVFLSDPDKYDGGELEIRILDETKLIKLPAGSALCYTTGLYHAVRPVTRGSRLAAVYWFQSLIRDLHVRRVIWEQYELQRSLLSSGHLEFAERAASVRENLVRYLADV
jgi:PKHD-type hydroxylase